MGFVHIEAEQIGADPVGVGTRTRGTSKILGRRFDWVTETVEFDRPRGSSVRAVEGQLAFSVTYLCEGEAGGTRFTCRMDAESGLGGIFDRVADPIVQRAQARTVRANLETLAEVLAEMPEA